MDITLYKPAKLNNTHIQLPGSKSISNRLLIIQALSGLNFKINNLSNSDDTQHLVTALAITKKTNPAIIDVGHAGTDLRFLTAFLSTSKGVFELTGSERIQQRPIKELVAVLMQLGANINYKYKEGFPPLVISGKKLKGGKAVIKGNVSSQFISALLLSAPYFETGIKLIIEDEIVSKPYIEMTIKIMMEFGAEVFWEGNNITVSPFPYNYNKKEYLVECDWSAASYFYSIVALSPLQTQLPLQGLFKNSVQADSVCEKIFNRFGVTTSFKENEIVIIKNELPTTSLFEFNFMDCPDIAQTLVCTCVGLKIPFYFTGLQTLKLKETDRITALKNELLKCNIEIQTTDKSIKFNSVSTSSFQHPVSISTYEDHRMAMSFAPISLLQDLVIEDAEVVNKSYPNFWKELEKIGILITTS